jgi:hypothetical protein
VLAANDNHDKRNLELAAWKMLRAGMPVQVICASLGIRENQLSDVERSVQKI